MPAQILSVQAGDREEISEFFRESLLDLAGFRDGAYGIEAPLAGIRQRRVPAARWESVLCGREASAWNFFRERDGLGRPSCDVPRNGRKSVDPEATGAERD
jgi:hypothetical protein